MKARTAAARTVMAIILVVAAGSLAWAQLPDSWTELSPATSPPARYGHTMVNVNGTIYLFGGFVNGTPSNDLWRWNEAEQNWEQVQASGAPPARAFHNAVAAGGKMYVAFGVSQSYMLYNDLWEFDPSTSSWRQIALQGPAGRFMGGMVSLGDGRVFIGGGLDSTGYPISDAWIGDLTQVAQGASLFAPQRIADLPRSLYAFFGFVGSTASGDPTPMIYGGEYHTKDVASDVYLYNPEQDQWEPVTPLGASPIPAGNGATSQYEEHVWIFGGESSGGQSLSYTQTYDTKNNLWAFGTPAPVTLVSSASAVITPAKANNQVQVLVFGGYQDGAVDDKTFIYTSSVTASTILPFFIPAAAHVMGLNNTVWRTDLVIHNKGNADATVQIELLRRDYDNSSPESRTVTIAAGRSSKLADVLDSLFSFEGAAALRLTSDSYMLLATSRTYNQTSEGTYGQFIPAATVADTIPFGTSAYLPQLSYSSDPSHGYRTNIGLVNTMPLSAQVQIDLYDGDGTKLGSLEASLQPYGYIQMTNVFASVTSNDVENGFAVVQPITQECAVIAYASVVDNVTGDAIYIPAYK